MTKQPTLTLKSGEKAVLEFEIRKLEPNPEWHSYKFWRPFFISRPLTKSEVKHIIKGVKK